MSWWELLLALALGALGYVVVPGLIRSAARRRAERDGPSDPPRTWVAVVLCGLLVLFAAFGAGLLDELTPLRLALFVALAAGVLYGFRRGMREFF